MASLPLEGKVAVVTGASSGIGAAIARALVRHGCAVALGARRVEKLRELAEAIVAKHPLARVHVVRVDVAVHAEVGAMVDEVERMLGPVDVLVNNAGVMYYTLMKNVHVPEWDKMVDVNCKGVMHGVAAVLPRMLARGSGHIVNITSDAGRKAFPGLAVYSGTKFFVEAMSQALRVEVARTGVRVTCVQPGNVATGLLALSTDQEAVAQYGQPSGARVLDPEDVANAVLFALTQPEHVGVNEVLVEPREEPV